MEIYEERSNPYWITGNPCDLVIIFGWKWWPELWCHYGKFQQSKNLGVYILHILGEKYSKSKAGLYREDGISCFENISGSKPEWDFMKIWKAEFNFSNTSETNSKIVYFLDVTLDLIKSHIT